MPPHSIIHIRELVSKRGRAEVNKVLASEFLTITFPHTVKMMVGLLRWLVNVTPLHHQGMTCSVLVVTSFRM